MALDTGSGSGLPPLAVARCFSIVFSDRPPTYSITM